MGNVDMVILTHADDRTAPPSMPVLMVSVVADPTDQIGGDTVSLVVAEYVETNKVYTYNVLHEFTVLKETLLYALEGSR